MWQSGAARMLNIAGINPDAMSLVAGSILDILLVAYFADDNICKKLNVNR